MLENVKLMARFEVGEVCTFSIFFGLEGVVQSACFCVPCAE
jgi:hypothetical protein